jgi:ATP-dependent protease ClpP protease subunit
MQTAGPGDTIYLHLNNSGGQLNTGVQIINAMQNSQARVVTILESLAHSLATLIFLAGDEMVVHDHCMMMFHNFRGGFGGKGQEVAAEIEATITWFVTLAQDMYIPFLSQDEFNRIIRGEDLWMQSPEIRERLEHMFKVLGEQQTAAEAEQQEKVPTAKKIPTKKVPTAKKIPTKKVPSTKAKVAK